MKHTILIALLGAAVTLAVPSISYADNGYKTKRLDQAHQKSHVKKDRRYKKNIEKLASALDKLNKINGVY